MRSDDDVIALMRVLWPSVTSDRASDDFLKAHLESIRLLVSITKFGAQYDFAIAHLLAHVGIWINPTGEPRPPGQLLNKQTGAISVGFGKIVGPANSLSDASYTFTSPGVQYLTIRSSLASVTAPFCL